MAENNKKGEKSKEGVCLAFSFVYYVFLFFFGYFVQDNINNILFCMFYVMT